MTETHITLAIPALMVLGAFWTYGVTEAIRAMIAARRKRTDASERKRPCP